MTIPDIQFTPTSLDNTQIEIIELADLYQRSSKLEHDPSTAHRVHFHMLIYIEHGQGQHFIDFNPYAFETGSFISIAKNQVHAFDFSNKLSGKVILFTDQFIEQIQINMKSAVFSPRYLDLNYSPIFTPNDRLSHSSKVLIAEIDQETKVKHQNKLIIMMLFSSLLLMLIRARPAAHTSNLSKTQSDRFSTFMSLLDNGQIKSRDASLYASKLNISYKTLNQICKLAIGQTAKQLIDSYTIVEIKRRLVLEQQHIQQLAYDLGFEDASNFIKYFKKHTHTTPKQFIKQLKG